ncbi:dioxygenase family protein [Flavobacterium caeni]|uniref:Dioxygenase n=1 Tax=Flavobacterium caeni TaxID=490189 RepID=A0A1G5G8R2_9FLAO|nr:intradiol ring-cleavage dioxygenase [Flavobacterium caeni]SCY47721.1 Dioxygenase [Flavobacterium caeni]
MERKDFLKGLGLIGLGTAALPIIGSCSSDDDSTTTTGGAGDMGGETCDSATTPSETEGPYPTHTPNSLVVSDIRSDRQGIDLEVNIDVVGTSGAAVAGALVDLWHCDKDGNYSEYGSFTSVHFLRGRQATNNDGRVTFLTKFPGWYQGRATHLHVHIYTSTGQSLLVTQIAYPEGSDSAVVLVNASTENGYTKGMNGYTYNANDGIFSNSYACETCTISGSVAGGYTQESTIIVNA